jgi:hypothetical protein
MDCKYLRMINQGEGASSTINMTDIKGDSLWLCNYGIKGPKRTSFGARHCPFKLGDDEVCLFPGGPFDPNDEGEPSVA